MAEGDARGMLEPRGFGPWVQVTEVGNVTLGSNEGTEHPRLEALGVIIGGFWRFSARP